MANKDPIRVVLEYIDENLDEYLSVGRLSEIANYSVPQLFRLFMADMDITPIKYVLRRRLYCAAKELVCSDLKIVDIAYSFRFESHDSFCRAFKRVYAVSPKKFRLEAKRLNGFYRSLFCVPGYNAPKSLIKQTEDIENMKTEHGVIHHVDIVTVPETLLIGVERLVGGGSFDAFSEIYDRIFRTAPNRKYPNSENATHGIPRVHPDGDKLLYFVGVEVTSLDNVPNGAVSFVLPEQLCAVIGYEGGVDYDEINDYFRDKWIAQSGYKLDPHKIDPNFPVDYAFKTYAPLWEYYSPNKDCPVYEERIYLPITHTVGG
ncbi:MAG: AraC family transcriptional regulator [Defluviitaleaceae bacterium]|nr:AraC family transcriptional regulator [Defluviitaleaceae bacterium]